MAATERLSLLIESRTTGEQEVNKLADAINRVTTASEKLNEKKAVPDHSSFDKFAEGVKSFIEDPLHSAGEAVEGLLKSLGPVGAGVATAAGGFALYAKEVFEAAHSLGEYGTQIENISLRTGLSTKEVGQFSYAAKLAGQDVTVFESAMRKLSQGLADNTEDGKKARQGLRELGVQAVDLQGNVRPMSDIFIQISEALNHIEGPANRNAAALKIFGRAGVELIPTMLGLAENVKKAQEMGLGPSEAEVKRWEEYHQAIVTIETVWERFKRSAKEGIVAPVYLIVKQQTEFNVAHDKSYVMGERSRSGSTTLGSMSWDTDFIGDAAKDAWKRTAAQMHAGMSAEIALNDRLISEARAPSDDQGRLEEARNKLKELYASLTPGIFRFTQFTGEDGSLTSNDAILQQIEKQKRAVAGIEAHIQAVKNLEQAERSLESFEKQMGEKDLGPVSRIFAERDSLIRSGANPERASSAARIGASVELAKMTAEDQKRSFEMTLKAGQEAEKGWEDVYKTVDKLSKQTVTDFIEAVKKAKETARQIDGIQFDAFRSGIIAQSGRATRLAELNAGPGHEYEAVNAGYNERLNLAQRLYDLDMDRAALELDSNHRRIDEAKAEADLRRETQDAEIEHEVRLAELQRQRVDNIRNEAGQLFDALERGGAGLEQFLKSTANGWLRTIAQNAAIELFGGTSGHLALPGQTTTDGKQNWFGRILTGTPFSADPASKLNTAGDHLHVAATELIGAARALAVSPSSGGGGFSSAAGTFSRILGGGGLTDAEIADAGITPDALALLNLVPEAGPNAGGGYSVMGAGPALAKSGTSALYRDVGMAATVIAGGFGIYSGIQQGGARGALSASGSAAGMAGGLLSLAGVSGPAAPILMGLGLGLSLLPSLFPDRRAERQNYETNLLNNSAFTLPDATDYSLDMRGNVIDRGAGGRVTVVQNHYWSVDTMDAKSFMDNRASIGEAVRQELGANFALAAAVQSAASGG